MAKYFRWEITPEGLRYEHDAKRIDADTALDGVYVLRTPVRGEQANADEAELAYKRLAVVERAFRSLKSVDLNIRPIHHRLADRVKTHVLICMLAYYVEWHMRPAWVPLLFDDEHPGRRPGSSVSPAQRSALATEKARTKRTSAGLPAQSFQDWLKDLATIAKNHIEPMVKSIPAFDVITRPTPAHQAALQLLGVCL